MCESRKVNFLLVFGFLTHFLKSNSFWKWHHCFISFLFPQTQSKLPSIQCKTLLFLCKFIILWLSCLIILIGRILALLNDTLIYLHLLVKLLQRLRKVVTLCFWRRFWRILNILFSCLRHKLWFWIGGCFWKGNGLIWWTEFFILGFKVFLPFFSFKVPMSFLCILSKVRLLIYLVILVR